MRRVMQSDRIICCLFLQTILVTELSYRFLEQIVFSRPRCVDACQLERLFATQAARTSTGLRIEPLKTGRPYNENSTYSFHSFFDHVLKAWHSDKK